MISVQTINNKYFINNSLERWFHNDAAEGPFFCFPNKLSVNNFNLFIIRFFIIIILHEEHFNNLNNVFYHA